MLGGADFADEDVRRRFPAELYAEGFRQAARARARVFKRLAKGGFPEIDSLASNQLGYRRWAEEGWYYGVPLSNFAGWFAVSLLAFGILRKKTEANQTARLTGLSIILFFTLPALALGYALVALQGCALCLIHFFVSDAPRRRT